MEILGFLSFWSIFARFKIRLFFLNLHSVGISYFTRNRPLAASCNNKNPINRNKTDRGGQITFSSDLRLPTPFICCCILIKRRRPPCALGRFSFWRLLLKSSSNGWKKKTEFPWMVRLHFITNAINCCSCGYDDGFHVTISEIWNRTWKLRTFWIF